MKDDIDRLRSDASLLQAWADGFGPHKETVKGVSGAIAARVDEAADTIQKLREELTGFNNSEPEGKAMTEQHHDVAEVTEANKLTREFFLSTSFDPKPARPADTVEAAIAFTLAASEARRITELQSEEARERVARAMWDSEHLQPWDGPPKPGSTIITGYDRDTYRNHATAALASVVELLGEKP